MSSKRSPAIRFDNQEQRQVPNSICPQVSQSFEQDLNISSQESFSELIFSPGSSLAENSGEEARVLVIFESIQVREGDIVENIPDVLMAESPLTLDKFHLLEAFGIEAVFSANCKILDTHDRRINDLQTEDH